MLKNWLDKGKCLLGVHVGPWHYPLEEDCTQIQVCERCGHEQTRIEHSWEAWRFMAPDRCDQIRTCARCGAAEEQLAHQWDEPRYASDASCEQVQTCARCQETQACGTVHLWDEWVYLSADTCQQVQVCGRCRALNETERAAHRWGPWRYSEEYGEAVHDCTVCAAFGTHSDFQLLEETAYTARVWTGAASAAASADAARSDFRDDPLYDEWQQATAAGEEWAFWTDKLREEVQKEKAEDKFDDIREDTLHQTLDAFQKIASGSPDDLDEMIANRGQMDRLMEQFMHTVTSQDAPTADDGSRVGQIRPFVSNLDRYVMTSASQIHNKQAEFDAMFDLKRRIAYARTALKDAASDDARVYAYERENLRRLACEVQEFAQREHLMLARPIWGNVTATVHPDAIFCAGGDAVHRLVAQVCRENHLDLLPATGSGSPARFRFQQLLHCHVAVFDLRSYDREQELAHAEQMAPIAYELGMAFALGKPVVVVGRRGVDLPFDIDVEPVFLSDSAADAAHLAQAIDRALYGLQRGGSGNSVAATAAHAQQLGVQHTNSLADVILNTLTPDVLKDALKTRYIVADWLSNAGLRDHLLIYPAWAGAYPDPSKPRCFHVTAFRDWSKAPTEEVRRACRQHNIDYIRGDEVLNPDIIRAIWQDICRATHVIVDLSALNINAVLELGMAHVLGRNVLIIGQEIEHIRPLFDTISRQRLHMYTNDDMNPLRDALNAFLSAST